MMEEVSTSETLVNFHHTTRRNIPEDSHLHTRRCENLKSRHRSVNIPVSKPRLNVEPSDTKQGWQPVDLNIPRSSSFAYAINTMFPPVPSSVLIRHCRPDVCDSMTGPATLIKPLVQTVGHQTR
jgi:hypothetical protein